MRGGYELVVVEILDQCALLELKMLVGIRDHMVSFGAAVLLTWSFSSISGTLMDLIEAACFSACTNARATRRRIATRRKGNKAIMTRGRVLKFGSDESGGEKKRLLVVFR